MTQSGILLMVLAVIAATVGVVPAAALSGPVASSASVPGPLGSHQVDNDSPAVPPGAVFSGVVGVQDAELDGNIDRTAFGLQVSRSSSERAKAVLIRNQLGESEGRLSELRNRLTALNHSWNNGTISDGTFAARASELTARLHTVERIGTDMSNVSQHLPAGVLDAAGVNATAIDTLRRNAAAMSGPEVAAIARTIAGPDIGGGPPPFANATRGPPENAGPPARDGMDGPGTDNRPTANTTETAAGDDREGGSGASGAGNGTMGSGYSG